MSVPLLRLSILLACPNEWDGVFESPPKWMPKGARLDSWDMNLKTSIHFLYGKFVPIQRIIPTDNLLWLNYATLKRLPKEASSGEC